MPLIRFQFRRGPTSVWDGINPVLASGEPGLDEDTGELKIGDGTTPWGDLPGLVSGSGGGGSSYVYNQAVPSALWVISHGLGRFPSVIVVDSAGSLVVGDVLYESSNTVKVSFEASFGGIAYLN